MTYALDDRAQKQEGYKINQSQTLKAKKLVKENKNKGHKYISEEIKKMSTPYELNNTLEHGHGVQCIVKDCI